MRHRLGLITGAHDSVTARLFVVSLGAFRYPQSDSSFMRSINTFVVVVKDIERESKMR